MSAWVAALAGGVVVAKVVTAVHRRSQASQDTSPDTPVEASSGQRWPVEHGPVHFAEPLTQHKVLPSEEVLAVELMALYQEEGEDALLRRCVVAAGEEVYVHSVQNGAGFCVHIGADPELGVASDSLFDALINALLMHNEMVRSGDV